MIRRPIIPLLVGLALVFAPSAAARIPFDPSGQPAEPVQIICILGHYGTPSGCRPITKTINLVPERFDSEGSKP